MWDSQAPLQLLSSMPKKLSKENLEKLQMVIDADKYKNSLLCGFDLCEMYAPFCRDCKKTGIYPCAIAYINMLRANGVDVEIDAKPVNIEVKPSTAEPQVQFEVKEPVIEQVAEPQSTEEQVIEEVAAAEAVTTAPVEEVPAYIPEEPHAVYTEEETDVFEQSAEIVEQPPIQPQKEPLKRKIRIAVARKKL